MNSNSPPSPRTCTAFLQGRRVASGSYPAVAQTLAALDLTDGGLLVFDDSSGTLVDHPWPADATPLDLAPSTLAPQPEPAPSVANTTAAPSVGRPRLGVVAREVTLLPRHWDWLATQRGGASAALRRLVDEARRQHAQQDAQRLAKECAYRVMSALAGGWPGFEEASRALFGTDAGAFAQGMAHWPADAQAHLAWLTRNAFDALPSPIPTGATSGPATP